LYLIYANRVGRILDAVDDRHCRTDFGMSAADMRVLFALRRAGPSYALRPTELFRALLVTSGAITKQVDRLAAGGYVARQPGPAKSGGYLIHLTAKGFKTADEALTSLVRSSIMSVNTLTENERNQLCVLLEKMLFDLENRLEGSDSADAEQSPKVRASG
jgi:DNA-binding MarR family transcriptional regulator